MTISGPATKSGITTQAALQHFLVHNLTVVLERNLPLLVKALNLHFKPISIVNDAGLFVMDFFVEFFSCIVHLMPEHYIW